MFARILVALVRVYQRTLSLLLLGAFGPVCRFEPSCSAYAIGCLQGHGALRGSLLSLKRLCRCHPFHPGGYDPPPPPRTRPTFKLGPRAISSSGPPLESPSPSPEDPPTRSSAPSAEGGRSSNSSMSNSDHPRSLDTVRL